MPKKMTAKQKKYFAKGHAGGKKKAAKPAGLAKGKSPKKGSMPY